MRILPFALIAGLLAACQTGNVNDPSPNAEPVESIAEPTDGFENEIGVND